MSQDSPAPWVSVRAVAWVLDEAPVPADLAITLIAVARCCDQHGRGSYQSLNTLAEKTGKSPAQISRDIRRLRELGLLLLGDQSLPERHRVPAGQRPRVYDVPLGVSGAKPVRESKNKTGGRKEEGAARPDAAPAQKPTFGMDAGGAGGHPSHGSPPTPRMDAVGTPRMDARSTSRMDAPQRIRLNNPENNQSIRQVAQQLEGRRWLNGRYRPTDGEADAVIEEVCRRAADPVKHLVRYLEGMAEGDLADVVRAVMDPPDAGGTEPPPTPPPRPVQLPMLQAVPDPPPPADTRPAAEVIADLRSEKGWRRTAT